MDGKLSTEEFESTVNLALEGCKQIYILQKEALRTKYVNIKEEDKEEAEE
jgi:exosome complex component RRP41